MPKLTLTCPVCQKDLKDPKEVNLGSSKLISYKCGHLFARDITKLDTNHLNFNAVDNSDKVARDYQKTGVEFIFESGFNCIIGDQMRLGKTPQALLAYKNQFAERTPALYIVRAANLWQWIREHRVWCNSLPNGIFPIIGTTAWIPPGFSTYVISMDTFGNQGRCKCGHQYHEEKCKKCACKVFQSNGESTLDKLKKIPFKLVIVDEAHSFKNSDSNRSRALVSFMDHLNNGETDLSLKFNCTRCDHEWIETGTIKFDKRIGHKVTYKSSQCPSCGQYCYIQQQHAEGDKWNPVEEEKYNKLLALSKDSSTTEHERSLALVKANEVKEQHKIKIKNETPAGLILLTGTAIKNRADEYFVPLNLINPERFSSLAQFRNKWLEQDHKGNYSRVKHYLLDAFKEEIKPYVLRREKEDVFKELPALNRIFTIIEPEKDTYAKLYNQMLDKIEEKLAFKANPSFMDTAEDLMELRRICGMMKLSWVADYLEVSLMDSDNQKFAVGLHHEAVRDVLFHKLGGEQNCWKFSGKESLDRKNYIETHYTAMKQRIGILNMLAGGVGCDFHEIDTILILERQWSSADEEQFEFRFYNPDLKIKSRSTTVEYILAKGTLDVWWHDMVEEKRKVFGETISTHWNIQNDPGSFKQLLEQTLGNRL